MSYIIAYVRFPETSTDYPVECFRTDIRNSDEVVVRLHDGRTKTGVVTRTLYLHWNCKSRILCKASEANIDNDGHHSPVKGTPQTFGLVSSEAAFKELKVRGWIPLKAGNPHHSGVTYSNDSETANILFRKNGVDFQILQCREELPRPYRVGTRSLTEGRVVRHYLSQTTFNLYEGVLRFSDSFYNNENDYDRFFKSVGSRSRANEELRARIRKLQPENESEIDLRDVLSDCADSEGRIYLCDGVYI